MDIYVVGAVTRKGVVLNEVEHICCKCAGPVWTSPEGAVRVSNGCWPMCLTCAMKLDPQETKIMFPSKDEIRRSLGLKDKKDEE